MKMFLHLSLLVLFTSCASTMPGSTARTSNKDISVSVEVNSRLSEKKIVMYQTSVSNNTDSWMEVDSITLESASSSKVEILLGEKLSAWIEAKNLENKVSDYNTSLLIGSIAAAGAGVALGSNHSQTSSLGLIALGGAVTAGSAKDFMSSKDKVDFQKLFPSTHLYNSFVIPPKKVIQRWILVEYESPSVDKSFILNLKTKDKKEFRVEHIIPVHSPKKTRTLPY